MTFCMKTTFYLILLGIMKKNRILFCCCLLCLLIPSGVYSQQKASSQKKEFFIFPKLDKTKKEKYSLIKRSILPVSLMGAGLLLNHSALEKQWQEKIRNHVGNDYYNDIDDYLPYLPILQMYGADILGVEAKNHWFDQSKNLFIANGVTAVITYVLKRTTSKTRPEGSEHSFPSGHTSFAFTNAAVLSKEFEDSSPVFAYSGYAFAATTGAFRVVNNKHWVSDVLFGAGLGIFVTEMVYYFEPFKYFNPFIETEGVTLVPQFDSDSYGVYFSYAF